MLLSGRAGKRVIEEANRLMSEWLHDSPMKDMAFKTITEFTAAETISKIKIWRTFESIRTTYGLIDIRGNPAVTTRGRHNPKSPKKS